MDQIPKTRGVIAAYLFPDLHLKDRLEVGELEQPPEAAGRIDEDKPSALGTALSMGGQQGTKSAQIDKGQTSTMNQKVAVNPRQLHLELGGGGQVQLSGQYDLFSCHGDGRRRKHRVRSYQPYQRRPPGCT